MPKVKKIFPGLAIAFSFYFSVLFAIGLVLGYIGTKSFYKRFIENARIRSVFLDLGKWKIHLHHWLLGGLLILSIWLGGWIHELPKLYLGVIFGFIAHDIYDFNDWYKIISRNKKNILEA